jgi:AcrR family transcriptional regulator
MAALRVMSRETPEGLTLGAIAAEAGVTAGALVQRFGSKRDLLLQMFRLLAGGTETQFAALRKKHRSPLAVVRAYGDCIAEMGSTPASLAHHLSYLQMDFTDPDFQACAAEQAKSARKALREVLTEAVTSRELKAGTDTLALARTVQVTLNGSLMTWGFYQEGTSQRWVRQDLEVVLRPHLRMKRSRKSSSE